MSSEASENDPADDLAVAALATREAEVERETLVMAFVPVQTQLSPAPLCLQVLGQLCLISTRGDFPLRNAPRPGSRLKHPESFRACLNQISEEGYSAFMEADAAMNRIKVLKHLETLKHTFKCTHFKMLTPRVREHIQRSLDILGDEAGTDQEGISNLLPLVLERIKGIADESASLAEKVVEKYKGVIHTLEDVYNDTISKHQVHVYPYVEGYSLKIDVNVYNFLRMLQSSRKRPRSERRRSKRRRGRSDTQRNVRTRRRRSS